MKYEVCNYAPVLLKSIRSYNEKDVAGGFQFNDWQVEAWVLGESFVNIGGGVCIVQCDSMLKKVRQSVDQT